MTDRDRLAADLHDVSVEAYGQRRWAQFRAFRNARSGGQWWPWPTDLYGFVADRLIALGWTRRVPSVRESMEQRGMEPVYGDLPVEIVRPAPFEDDRIEDEARADSELTTAYMVGFEKGKDAARATGREDGLAEALDEDRLARAALRHYRAERDAWASRGESGVIHVCGWHDPKCAAAIAKAYREDTE